MESKEIKILAIVDNKDNLVSLKTLTSAAFPQAAVLTEENGQRGIESARFNEPDVVLLDIVMPGMDGYEVCKQLKSDKQLSDIPVVFITALKGDKESRIKALEAGGDGFLAKPVDESELTAQIIAMLKIREAARRQKDDRERLKELVAERTNELEANYALLHIAGQTARFGGWSVDLKTNVVRWSDAVAEIHEMPHGYKPKLDEGISFYAPEWKEKITRILNDCAQNGINYDEEMEIITAKGKRKWVRTIGEAIRNEKGDITIVHGSFQDISERKQSEVALQESNKKYEGLSGLMRLMADNMPDMLWAKNLDKEYIFTNKAICDTLLGASDTDEPLGKTDMFFALRERAKHQRDREWHTYGEICRDSDAITLQEMKPMQFDESYKVRGKHLVLDVHKAPLFDNQGNLIGVVGSARDITEQKNTQEEIRITRDTYQNIINSITEAIYVIDDSNTFIDVNLGAEKMYGFSREELIGKSPAVVAAAGMNDFKAMEKIHRDVAKTGISQSFEFWATKKNGDVFPKEVIINKGSYYGKDCLIATARDITERKRAETAHQAQYNIARSIHTASEIEELLEIVRTELGKLIDTSNFMAALYNPEKDTLKKLIYRDEKEDFAEWPAGKSLSGQVVKSGKPLFMRRREIEAFAAKNDIELTGTPAASWIGVPVNIKKKVAGAMVVQSYDNTEAFSQADVSLLEMIAHETGIYLEQQMMLAELIASKEKAEESNRLKTAFINNISHEIRTPLNGILGFGELIIEDDLPQGEKQRYFKVLEQSTIRLQQTITDIMDISEVTAESIKPGKNNVHVVSLMKELLESTEKACSSKNILISLDIPNQHKDLILKSDKELLIKIMKQLLDNAEKFTDSGRIILGYDVHGEWVQFHVKDTGQGIDDEKLEVIFEPFMQEDLSVTRGHEGNGLGLSIARGLVKLLGGELWAASEKGAGSTFFFTLPYLPAEAKDEPKEAASVTSEKSGKNLILIAEDEESNYMLLKTVAERAGFSTLHAIHGAEAVELCQQYPEIGLILMDIKMPVMNGLEATQKIKAFRPDLPIIALTAHAQTGDRQRMLDAGCDEYMAKPVNLDKLNALIKRMIT